MGSWGFYQYPTEPPTDDLDDHYAERESLDERAEQQDVETESEEEDWGAWLGVGERPVQNQP